MLKFLKLLKSIFGGFLTIYQLRDMSLSKLQEPVNDTKPACQDVVHGVTKRQTGLSKLNGIINSWTNMDVVSSGRSTKSGLETGRETCLWWASALPLLAPSFQVLGRQSFQQAPLKTWYCLFWAASTRHVQKTSPQISWLYFWAPWYSLMN